MSAAAPISDGKLVQGADTTKAVNTAKEQSSLGKDDFLQLLVAEMKYQDPLEPTSNTEYIGQYAQFSQVEMMQNMMSANQLQAATSLVGKYVTMNVTSEAGVVSQVSGRVEYVNNAGTNTYLYIDGQRYNFENLDTVWDDGYLEAKEYADTFAQAVRALPSADTITLKYYDQVSTLLNAYNSLSDYQKSFISSQYTDKLTAVGNKLIEMKKAADEAEAKAKAEAEAKENETKPTEETKEEDENTNSSEQSGTTTTA